MAGYRKQNTRRGSRKTRQAYSSSSLGWVWLFFGMFIGVCGVIFAYNVYTGHWSWDQIRELKTVPQPSTSKTKVHIAEAKRAPSESRGHDHHRKKDSVQQYEFYTLLPDREVELHDAPTDNKNPQAKVPTNSPKNTTAQVNMSDNINSSNHHKDPVNPLQKPKNDNPGPIVKTVQPPHNKDKPTITHSKTQSHQAEIKNPSRSSSNSSKEISHQKIPMVHAHNQSNTNTKIIASQYIVQAGIFRDMHHAEALKARLTLQGFNTFVQKVKTKDGEHLFRVTLGPYASQEIAQLQKKQLANKKIPATLIKQSKLTTSR